MPKFDAQPDEPDSAPGVSGSPAITGYLKPPDTDWFALELQPGLVEISVLPDLAFVRYDAEYLVPETALISAHLYTSYVDGNGNSGYLEVYYPGGFETKRDDLAMNMANGHTFGELSFIGGTFLIEPAHQTSISIFDPGYSGSTVRNFTGKYLLEVTGGALQTVTGPTGLAFVEEAGRYLVTTGNPTGQRTTTWGNWLDHYDGIATGPTQPDINNVYPSALPAIAQWTPDTSNVAGGYYQAESPTYTPDSSGQLTVGGIRVGPGLEAGWHALLLGMKDEAIRQAWEAIGRIGRSFAESFDRLQAAYASYQRGENIKQVMGTWVREQIRLIDEFTITTDDGRALDDASRNNTRTMVGELAREDSFIDRVMNAFSLTEKYNNDTGGALFKVTVDLQARPAELVGSAGLSNRMLGSANAEVMKGNDKSDLLIGQGGGDTLSGNNGDDALIGGTDADTLLGGAGKDRLWGGTGNDMLDGGTDDDTLYGDAGQDHLDGGAGTDTVDYADNTVAVIVTLTESTDATVTVGGVREDTLRNIENVTGGSGDDVLTGDRIANILVGGAGHDTLKGGGGADSLNGGSGKDYLDGGSGADRMLGGSGNDTYVIDQIGDVVVEENNEGADTIRTSLARDLEANIENIVLTGTADVDATGNYLNNVLTGNTGNNKLSGGGGLDKLTGGVGKDLFVLDAAPAAANLVKIVDFAHAIDRVLLSKAHYASAGAVGTLRTAAFFIGAAAQDADDRIIYDAATGRLIYDSDGSGTREGKVVAQLATGLVLTASDFVVGDSETTAVITGTAKGVVTEKGGVFNGTPGVSKAGGTLTAIDVDGAAAFVVQTNTTKSYGTFSIKATGAWTYTLDDNNATVQALNKGDRLHERLTVKTADGTSKVIDVAIDGANDAAVVTGTAKGKVVEKGGIANGTAGDAKASGDLDVTDVDGAATFVVQKNVTKSYGTFAINATGAWTYTLDDNNATIQALNEGDRLHERLIVKTKDGTSKVIDVAIDGANDAAVVMGTATGRVIEKGGIASGTEGDAKASGDLDVTDVDNAATFVVQKSVAKTYGEFTIKATGAWTYTLDDNNAAVQALNSGDRLHERVTIETADGTHRQIDITIKGASDVGFDVTHLTPARGFIVQGDAAGDDAGCSVSSAGDVNGDGFADLIVGARYGDDGGTDAGEAYVVFGKASGFGTTVAGRAVIDLTTLSPADGFIVQGDMAGDIAGRQVSSAGDVNGDGFADLIVGAPWGDDGGSQAGEAYVVFGKASGFGMTASGRSVVDLTTLSAADGFIVQGDVAVDYAGWSVSSAGDVNGDGFADLIVGAPGGDNVAGEAHVVFGKASGFGTTVSGRSVVDLTTLSAADGFIVQGDVADDNAGWSVSSAGDVNGDGFVDLIIGAPGGDDGGDVAGEAYVVFGKASGFGTTVSDRSVVNLTMLSPAAGFIVQGDAVQDFAGFSVSSAGDVNGDGFADLIVGAPGVALGGNEAYVVFGKASGFGTTVAGRSVLDLTTLSAVDGFVVQGEVTRDQAGISVSSAGDVNGDGFADLIVGANLGDDGGTNAGEAYVVFGKASGFGTMVAGRSVLDLANLSPTAGFIVQGDSADDRAGASVSSAGDVNGDGFADLIVGAPRGDDGGADAGEAYVLFGGAFGGSTTPVTTIGTSAAEILIGGLGDDTLSGSGGADSIRGGAGDDALSVGDTGFRNVDGGSGSDTLGLSGADLTLDLSSRTQSAKVSGIEAVDLTGTGNNTLKLDRLAVLNEVGANADGVHILTVDGNAGDTVSFVDVQWEHVGSVVAAAITYARYVNGDAEVRVEQDVAVSFPSVFDLTSLTPAQGFIVQGDVAGDNAGCSVSSAEDVNGDGFADLIVGAPRGDDGGSFAGEAYVVFGKASGFGTVDGTGRSVLDLTTLSPGDGFIIQGDAAYDLAGFGVSSAGDVNGDGFADLIVGAIGGDDGGSFAGEAYVVFGKASGLGTTVSGRSMLDLTTLSAADGFIVQGDVAYDYVGYSVSSAGDVNGDGFADLIVGAIGGDDGGNVAGEAYVVFGKASGFGTTVSGRSVLDLTTLSAADGFIVQGDVAYDQAGWSVSSAGDVNDDGFADLIVGAPFGDDGGPDAGEAYVVYGKASGFGTTNGTGRAVIDLSNAGLSFTAFMGFIIQGDLANDQGGFSVASAGDIDGDGFADLIVGAQGGDDGGPQAGEAYVVFGAGWRFLDGTGRAVIDLSNIGSSFTSAQGFVIQGDTAGDQTGWSVSSAGDMNGDGFVDIVVGAKFGDDGGTDAGEAYVVFGKASGFGTVDGTGRSVVDLTSLGTQGFTVRGDDEYDRTGWSVSSAGDVNGDGFADLIVGAPLGDDGGVDAGEAYVLLGGAFGASTTPVTTVGTGAAEILIGGLGDDTLSGGGGADSIRGGAGADTLSVVDLTFRGVDGGSGSDTLVLLGSGQDFDFTTLANSKLSNIETVDITGTGNNSLTLGFADIAAINDGDPLAFIVAHSHNALVVEGNAGDTLTLQGYDPDGAGGLAAAAWTLVGSDVGLDGSAGGAYDLYDLKRGSTVLASVAMDADISKI